MESDIRKLDLNLLRALDALLDERSVTRAADRLALTQPAVTGMLNRLRESFNDPLFVRAQRGIVPTLRAEQLALPIKQLLADVAGMLQPQAFDPQTAELTIKLASTDYALRAIVVPFLSALRERASNIRISVLPIDDQTLQLQLERGDVDLALVANGAAAPDLYVKPLFDESYVCVMRADHPDSKSSQISLTRFCALDHVLVSPSGGGFHGVTDEALRKIGKSRRVTVSVTSFLVLPEILMASDLIAVVPRRLAIRTPGLTIVEPPVKIPGFCKMVAWHERTHRDAGHRWIRTLMLETVKTL
ncbi:LysR family transcriptional regulator [Pseudomonas sp. LFS044]|uniref:LysR family transcriptional regulator n=1 Tax=Pseudomonas sp. LFS044 TaxID=3229880 RepID=UPI003A7FAD12